MYLLQKSLHQKADSTKQHHQMFYPLFPWKFQGGKYSQKRNRYTLKGAKGKNQERHVMIMKNTLPRINALDIL